jgi:hypothetical protein
MGFWGYLFSPLGMSMIGALLVTGPLPFILNSKILEGHVKYAIPIMMALVFAVTGGFGFIASLYASFSQCAKVNFLFSFLQSLRQAGWSLLVYLIVFMVPYLKSPFIDIGGDNLVWNSIGEGFFLGMTNVALTISTYFQSQIRGCQMSEEDAEKSYDRLHKKLNSKKKAKKVKKISPIPNQN